MISNTLTLLLIASAAIAGTIVQWGDNTYGQMENIPYGDFFVQIDAGNYHAVALRSNGIVDAWGSDSYGQGTDPGTGIHFLQVDAGSDFNIGIKDDGYLYQWGDDFFVIPPGYLDFQYSIISFGINDGAGVTVEGNCYSWGVMGNPPTMTNCLEISAGGGTGTTDEYIAAIDGDSIVIWGDEEMEFPSAETNAGFVHVSAGISFCVAVRSDGTLLAWGDDAFGQVSNLPLGDNFVDVSAGGWHGLAVTADGEIEGWGRNDYQQCVVPVLSGDSAYTKVSTGILHSLAIREYSEPQGIEESTTGEIGFFVMENPSYGAVLFSIQPQDCQRYIELYSLAGRRIDVLEVPAAAEAVQWATGMPEGLYWAVLDDAATVFTYFK